MRKVAILGIGQTPVSEHWDKSLKELAGQAVFAALNDAGRTSADGLFVGNMLSGSLNHQENLGVLIADWVGLRNVEAVKVESACSSGGSALRAGLIAVASGEMDCAVVVGVEKMTDSRPNETSAALATAADADYEAAQGLSFVAINALVMQRYMYEYGWKHADFAPFSIVAHANAVNNPFARLPFAISTEEYRQARMVAEPINLLDASPIGDGAAAVVLVPAEQLPPNGHPGVHSRIAIAGSASATDTIAVHDRPDPLWLSAAALSARKAYAQAGLGPEDIDFFELHDAFSIMSALSLEACGFAERGQGPRLGLEGDLSLGRRLPIATMGGLKARGHPVGATGLYQIVEIVTQLRGQAGLNQLERARVGMAQNIGGSGATIVTHILKVE
jgi:acetyl-CoA C-acetyltransferase